MGCWRRSTSSPARSSWRISSLSGFERLSKRYWSLDPATSFLNHGSFGACPTAVLAEQSRLRSEMESDPVRFLARDLWRRLDDALAALGAFVGADPADLAFVANATAGVNAALRSLVFKPGDEILITDHAYEACAKAARYVADRSGARLVLAQVPFPIQNGAEVVEAVLKAAGPRVRLAMLDHVTSSTAPGRARERAISAHASIGQGPAIRLRC